MHYQGILMQNFILSLSELTLVLYRNIIKKFSGTELDTANLYNTLIDWGIYLIFGSHFAFAQVESSKPPNTMLKVQSVWSLSMMGFALQKVEIIKMTCIVPR